MWCAQQPVRCCLLLAAHSAACCCRRRHHLRPPPAAAARHAQVSPDAGLLQCSTVADVVDFTFSDGQVRRSVETDVRACCVAAVMRCTPWAQHCTAHTHAQDLLLRRPPPPMLLLLLRLWLNGLQVHPVVGAYMEFVERKPLPQHAHLEGTGQLREHHRCGGPPAQLAARRCCC